MNFHRIKKSGLGLLLGLSLSAGLLSGCSSETSGKSTKESGETLPASQASLKVSRTNFLLDTVVTITLYGTEDDSLIQGAFSLISDYEQKLSRTIETSEIAKLNRRETDTVSEDTAELIEKALYYGKLSDGALDISIGSVSSLWDFKAEEPEVPDADKIAEGVTHVDYTGITLSGTKVTFSDPDTILDLGAVAKGFIADKVKEYLLANGQKYALISLGGNLLSVGNKPDGSDFTIGVQKPFDETGIPMITFSESDLSVVTSGIYERYFKDENGKLYHHILDPGTGYPTDNDLYSVTIISKESVDGDCLSTTCFCLGMEKAMKLIDSLDDVYAIFITDDYKVTFSEGLQEAFPNIQITK